MKKLMYIFTISILLNSSFVVAQTIDTSSPVGFTNISGGLNICDGKCDKIDPSYSGDISIFFKLIPNLYLGGFVNYGNFDVDIKNTTLHTISYGSEVMINIQLPFNPSVSVFGLGGIAYTKGKLETDVILLGTISSSDKAWTMIGGGGLMARLNRNLGLGTVFKYSYNKWQDDWKDSDLDINSYYLGFVLSLLF